MTDQPHRSDAFAAAEFPPIDELTAIERELKPLARSRAITCMHAEIVWRVRRGESVTLERLVAIWPVINEGLWRQYIQQLQSWGVLHHDGPVLQLSEAA